MPVKAIRVTFKENESELYEYATKNHSSPAAWIKDLIIADMNREKKDYTKEDGKYDLFD